MADEKASDLFIDISLRELMEESHQTAIAKGWWEEEDRNVGEICALFHSEISEAFEEHRNGHSLTEIYYEEGGKPCGFPVEIADLLIRAADYCEHKHIPVIQALCEKLEYNRTRPYRHGGKKA